MIKTNKQLEKYVIKTRRALHKIPEPGFEEVKTQEYIQKELDRFGLSYEKYGKTGIVCEIKADIPQKTIAYRTDMDGLSITEETNVDFKSTHEGYMHACGHDGHMTIMLTFAKYLSEHRDQMENNAVLIFQPAEEGPGGAKVLIEEGLFDAFEIDEIYGYHLMPEIEEGKFATLKGPFMASTGEFYIDIFGKSGHGAKPDEGIDSIVVASDFIQSIQSIVSREISPIDTAVITVGTINGGQRLNIIAEKTHLEGTMRAFNNTTFQVLKDKISKRLDGLSTSYGCRTDVTFKDMYPAVINDDYCVEKFIRLNGEENFVTVDKQMIAEDFSYYLKEVPGAFIFLGTKNEVKGFVNPLHSSQFNFDEEVLLKGVQGYINLIKK